MGTPRARVPGARCLAMAPIVISPRIDRWLSILIIDTDAATDTNKLIQVPVLLISSSIRGEFMARRLEPGASDFHRPADLCSFN